MMICKFCKKSWSSLINWRVKWSKLLTYSTERFQSNKFQRSLGFNSRESFFECVFVFIYLVGLLFLFVGAIKLDDFLKWNCIDDWWLIGNVYFKKQKWINEESPHKNIHNNELTVSFFSSSFFIFTVRVKVESFLPKLLISTIQYFIDNKPNP